MNSTPEPSAATSFNICVLGAGFVGLTTATVFAQQGHQVAIVDVSAERREALLRGDVPFHEPGLTDAVRAELKSGRLTVATDAHKAMVGAEFVFLCVGTPSAADGSVDLTYIRSAAAEVGRAIRDSSTQKIVVVKSTVPPGTLTNVVVPEVEGESGRGVGDRWGAASNPEFLKEGVALEDAQEPDRVVVGVTDSATETAMRALYGDSRCSQVFTTPNTAEMIKYAANSFLAIKIAYANEFANLCEKLDIDWYDVIPGLAADPRIGGLFLRPGVGFGGSCFPKDLAAIRAVAREQGRPITLVEAALEHNDVQPMRVIEMLEEELGDLHGKRIALLGLAFKPDTDDVRETRALPIWKALVAKGADVVCHDPMVMDGFAKMVAGAKFAVDTKAALTDADACVFQTEWKQYRALDAADFTTTMKRPLLVDGRRVYEPATFRGTPVIYRPIGVAPHGGARK